MTATSLNLFYQTSQGPNDGPPASVGTYEGEFEVTFADSTIETFPNSGFFSITVTDDLA